MKKTYSVPVVNYWQVKPHGMIATSNKEIQVSNTTSVTADMADVKEESGNGIWD